MTANTAILPAPRWTKRDWGLCLLLGFAALLLYGWGRNAEFQGDDDFLYAANFSAISNALLDFLPGGPGSVASNLANFALQLLCAPRHAPLPALTHATFYAAAHLLHLPFSLTLLQLPTEVTGIVSVLLCYGLLRRQELHRPLSLAGALLLLFSPVFAMCSRGLATYFLVNVPFAALIALWGLASLAQSERPRWWIGLALAQVVVADLIWFVTLPLLLAAYVMSQPDWRGGLRTLLAPRIFLPVVATAALLLLATGWAVGHGLSTPLSKLFTEHGAKVSQGGALITSPGELVISLAFLLGTAFPVLLPAGLVARSWLGRPSRPRVLTAFGVVGSVVYGILFYGLTSERDFVKLCYQVYLLIPLILLSLALAKGLSTRRGVTRRVTACAVTLLLLLELLACITFIWKVPVSPFSNHFGDWAHGTVAPNRGTKAAGYVVRRWLEATWRLNPGQPVTVMAAAYNTSFAVFSGINAGEKGWAYVPEFGLSRPLRVLYPVPALQRPAPPGQDLAPMVYLIDLTGQARDATTVAALLASPSLLTYRIRSLDRQNGSALVYILPLHAAAPQSAPEDLEMSSLESAFDRDYTSYSDFFARLPNAAGQPRCGRRAP